MAWYTITAEAAIAQLTSSPSGLLQSEAEKRFAVEGPNELKKEDQESAWKLLFEQFTSPLVYILIIAAVVSIFLGKEVEPIAIMTIVILAGIFGFIQEYRAGKAIESLRQMAAAQATVIREGHEIIVPAKTLVPGDIILLKSGDRVPADLRLIQSINLKIEEASLTGESMPAEKTSDPLDREETSLGDRTNICFMGTSVAYGRGKGIVIATGMKTEFGKIAHMLEQTETRKTPLQEQLAETGRLLGFGSIGIAAVLSIIEYMRGKEIAEIFLWGVSLAVAIIPEALPAVVTVTLALGVRRMVKRRALIRKLPAVETLGSTTVICSDKTGTLTQDAMTVRKIFIGERLISVEGGGYSPEGSFTFKNTPLDPAADDDLLALLRSGVFCNDSSISPGPNGWESKGDPTEAALITAAQKAGIETELIRTQYPRIFEIPFSSEQKRMTTVHEMPGGLYAFSKGAPEYILHTSCSRLNRGEEEALLDEARAEILEAAKKMGGEALRVLAVSYKHLGSAHPLDESIEHEMVFAGLAGMIDPPREEAKEAIHLCESAGIKPIMITGDHKITAVAIARELGILKDGQALSGEELDKLSPAEFNRAVDSTEVYARISPAHKLNIVSALMNKGHIVAMTGDGVNDAPALKKADIGIAMGITGTDVSKEAADMVLTDDNFASIVAAIEEGRGIFNNIRKYLVFLLSGNLGTVFGILAAMFAGWIQPLSAAQILFINFIMDGMIAIALGVDPPEHGVMRQKPRKLNEKVLNKNSWGYIITVAVWIAVVCSIVFFIYLPKHPFTGSPKMLTEGAKTAMTMFFVTLIFSRMFNALSCRSLGGSIIETGLFGNKTLLYGFAGTIALTLLVLYWNVLQRAFQTAALTPGEWAIAIAASSSVLIAGEVVKLLTRSENTR